MKIYSSVKIIRGIPKTNIEGKITHYTIKFKFELGYTQQLRAMSVQLI